MGVVVPIPPDDSDTTMAHERYAAMDRLHTIQELVIKYRTHPAMSADDALDQIEDVIES